MLEQVDRGVTMSLLGVDGPGTVTMYLQAGNLEPPDVLWSSETAEAQPVWVELNTHTHASWVFSEPGVYLLQVEVAADLITGETVTDTRTVRFAVGDANPDDARAATFAGPVAEPPTGGEAEDERATGSDRSGGPTDGADAGTAGEDEGGVSLGLVAAGVGAALVLVAVAAVLGVRGSRAKRRAEADRHDGHRPNGLGSGEAP